MEKSSQNSLIIRYMIVHWSITPKEAEDHCGGCMRLASRINQIKKAPYNLNIKTEIERYTDKEGKKRHYARYSIAE